MENEIDIKELRASLGVTQSQLAEALGLDQSTISNWENGHQNPRGPAKKLLKSLTRDDFFVSPSKPSKRAEARESTV
ncbi:DNA-binding transcriptional regulator [Shinella sp. JR1-6]|uniref:helix-turn-helix domain-containing protein n=1 Tax=Shinella sp. JR1-6 TaxID=2527671 RepID=UPI00102D560A|nr:helix-turn-helix transcriptional regulator [Shinella sp. JR1-6]TAA48937.1 XRE family transcriptional regulator [Shinella sp. JR1-6]